MSRQLVIDQNELSGIFVVLTEMALQGFEEVDIADVIRPMRLKEKEVFHALSNVEPTWIEIDYLTKVYSAWQKSEEDE